MKFLVFRIVPVYVQLDNFFIPSQSTNIFLPPRIYLHHISLLHGSVFMIALRNTTVEKSIDSIL